MTTGRIHLNHFAPLMDELGALLDSEHAGKQDRDAAVNLLAQMALFQRRCLSSAPPPSTAHVAPPSQGAQRASLERSPYYGMGIGEAARECIKIHGVEMFGPDIWAKLASAGFQCAHEDPSHAVYDALRRRTKRERDVVRTPTGAWGLVSWYNEEQLADFSGANRSERTKVGMEMARERGAQIGARNKLMPSDIPEIVALIEQGLSLSAIAARYGVVRGTIINNVTQAKIAEIRSRRRAERAAGRTARSKPKDVSTSDESDADNVVLFGARK